jgi:arylformamidase
MKVIDLTLEITPNIRTFPGSPQPAFIPWSKFDTHRYFFEVMFLSTHTGTHIDAPCHFIPNSTSIDELTINRFVCQAILLKIPKKADETITYEDVINYKIKENDTVVFFTEWGKKINEDNYMSNNPGLSPDAAEYLVNKKVNGVAIDGPSIDRGVDTNFPTHNILLSNNILVIENLCNLEKLNNQLPFTLVIAPLKLVGASGSPVRAIAIEEKEIK